MKKIFIYNLLSLCVVSSAFAKEDSVLLNRALSEVLNKYSTQINKNNQTKTMVPCCSDYFNKKLLDLEHFIFCCNSSIGRDVNNLGVCQKMAADMRDTQNKYKQYEANNIPVFGQSCNPVFDNKTLNGLFCPDNFAVGALDCSAQCDGITQKWVFKIEKCEKGWKPAQNNLACVVDPTAVADVEDNETPYRGKTCVSGQDKPIKNVKCPSDWGATTSCDVECLAGMWTYSINGCKNGSHIDTEGGSGICLADAEEEHGTERKFHAECMQQDLPDGALTGWYIKSNKTADGLTCAAKTCDNKHYLVRNAKGVSMGWCRYGKDPEIVKQGEAEELARLKAENANLEMLTSGVNGLSVASVRASDVNLPGVGNKSETTSVRETTEMLNANVSGINVAPVSASDVKIQITEPTNEFTIKNCKQSDLNALHAVAGTERSDGCYVQKCKDGYHLELNGRRITLTENSSLDKNIKCVKDVVLPTVGASCPDSRFKDAKHQLPANASAGKFVKQGNDFICSATACSGSDYEVVTENGTGVCKKKIAKLQNDVHVLQNDTTYVAPTYIKQAPQNMPQQQNYFNIPGVPSPSETPQYYFKQG